MFLKEPIVEPLKDSERTQPPGFDNDGFVILQQRWAEPPEHVHYMGPPVFRMLLQHNSK